MIIKGNLDLVESSVEWLEQDLVPVSEIIPKLSFNLISYKEFSINIALAWRI